MRLEAAPARGPAPRAVLVAIAAGAAATLVLRSVRDFPWSLALIVGVAIGVFTTMALRTARVLRALWTPPDDERPRDEREPPPD